MVKVLGCEIIVSKFKLNYYVQFQINTIGKGMNLLILPAMGQIVPLLVIYKDAFGLNNP